MDSSFAQWCQSSEIWMQNYRRHVLRNYRRLVVPAVLSVTLSIGASTALIVGGSWGSLLVSIVWGIGFLLAAMTLFGIVMLPFFSTKRISKKLKRAVKKLGLSELEQEQLGSEMLEAQKHSAQTLEFENPEPYFKNKPAKLMLSKNFVCMWGGFPLVVLIPLGDIAVMRNLPLVQSAKALAMQKKNPHMVTMYPITFHRQQSRRKYDYILQFMLPKVRNKAFDMLKAQGVAFEHTS